MRRLLALIIAFTTASSAGAQNTAETVRFITCPIYRDTDAGKKSGCWLADERETGRRFDVTGAPSKPDWNHEVLVEGRVSTDSDICGGVVLAPVRVSVLPGACTRQMLPAENYTSKPFTLPLRNVRPVSEMRPTAQPPFATQTFYLLYDFDQHFIVYQLDDYLLDQAITYIRSAKPRKIVVTGYAATTPTMVSGRKIAEDGGVAKRRAQSIAEALVRLGVEPTIIETSWSSRAAPVAAPGADGLEEASRRRVEIRVIP